MALRAVPWFSKISLLPLRIDVEPGEAALADELAGLYERLQRPGNRLYGLPEADTDIPGLVLRYREADGEFYVYVEDRRRKRLAGYTVFNRLIEVGRRGDRYVRAPHSKFAAPYRRMGLASSVYRWALEGGQCLLSGARQSAGAYALWQALARHYPLSYVRIADKCLHGLGTGAPPDVLDDLQTRMLLLGRGWSLAAFSAASGMRMAD